MHLAVYTDAQDFGGAEQSLGNLLAELPSDFRVTVLGTRRSVVEAVAARRSGAEVMLLAPVTRKRDIGAILGHIRAVRKLRPDVLHANLWTPWSGQYGILAGLLAPGVRTIAVEQLPLASTSAWQRWLKRHASRRLSAHVAVGERAARLVEEMAMLRPHSIRTVYNGVPGDPGGEPRVHPHRPVIGSLGRLHEQKGYDVLVRALPEIPEAHVVIVGDGPERGALEALASELGVSDRLELVGWREDARAWLASFDVFALPSRFEGFPLAIVEAMLAGTAVVATDVGSVPEAVVHGRTGLLVDPDDASGLAAELRGLLADEDRRRAMAATAREVALERFSAAAMARAYTEIWAEITTDGAAPARPA